MLVALGHKARITCQGENLEISYGNWYQAKLCQAPVLVICCSSNRASSVPYQYSGSNSEDTPTLTTRGAQAEDRADYYCQFGDGRQLAVTRATGK